MASDPELAEYAEPVVEKLEEIHRYGHSRHRVFDDWLELMTYALQRDDDNYLDIMDQYDEEEAQLYAEAFGELQQAMGEANHELLGVVYEEMAVNSDAFGQHFTPHNLCGAMAEMILSDIDKDEDREEPYRIQDPASGSGRLLISAAKKLPDDVDAEFYGIDKDSTCAKMTALNLCFFNMDGYSIQGDSLTMDYRRAWATRQTLIGGEIRELDDDEFQNPYEEAKQEVEQEETPSESDPGEDTGGSTVDLGRQAGESTVDHRETTLTDYQDPSDG